MTDYKPGTVAKATVRNVTDVLVLRRETFQGGADWAHSADRVGYSCSGDHLVTDVRPLVVLDPDDTAAMDKIAENFFHEWSGCQGSLGIALAETLRKEAKPPRIPEPTGVGAVVQARIANAVGGPTLLVRGGYSLRPWHAGDLRLDWDSLVDPILVREGV
jgi:hypothetical protein